MSLHIIEWSRWGCFELCLGQKADSIDVVARARVARIEIHHLIPILNLGSLVSASAADETVTITIMHMGDQIQNQSIRVTIILTSNVAASLMLL